MLQKRKEFYADRRLTGILLGLFTILLLGYSVIRVPFVNIVWELADEYGYLANAAYMSKTDWSFMVNLYYGYGYSFWLVPFFWVCDTGVEIIRGAVFMNGMSLVLLFWVQFFLMSALYKKTNRTMIALLSFVMCFFPYLTASGMKVLPECLLTLMIWVCGLVLYLALTSEWGGMYVLLAVCMVYTYFVHIRSFVFCAILIFVLVVMFLQKKVCKKNFFVFVISCVVLFLVGTLFKNHITEVVYSELLFEHTTEIRNTVSIGYIWEKIAETIKNVSWIQLQSFACKCFYLFVASAGMFYVGVFASIKEGWLNWRRKRHFRVETAVKWMYVASSILMVLALVVNPMGAEEGTGHYFYARYYEYLVGPVIFAGLCDCIEKHLKGKEVFFIVAVFGFCMLLSLGLSKHLETQELYADTNRMSAFSFLLEYIHTYQGVIIVGFVIALAFFLLFWLLSKKRKVFFRSVLVVFLLFLCNDAFLMRQIIRIHRYNNVSDREITNYIHENYEVEELYFLNGDEVYITVYTSLQSLLGKEKLTVIQAEDLKVVDSGDLLITFSGNPYLEKLEREKTKVFASGSFELYIMD